MQVRWGDSEQTFTLPVYHSPQVFQEEVLNEERAFEIPPEMREQLRRSGQELRRRRVWAPLRTEDHQAILVPVDQFELRAVNP